MLTALFVMVAWFLLALALPLLALARTVKADRRAAELGERLARLERRLEELIADRRRRTPAGSPETPRTANVPAPFDDVIRQTPREPAAAAAANPSAPRVDQVTAGGGAVAVHNERAGGVRRRGADWASLERRIGTRWLLYVGIGALVLGVSYFVKFAFDNAWITESMRVGVGAAAGALLIAGGRRFAARGLGQFGQALMGGGLVALGLSIYAAFEFYRLIGPAPAFVLLGATVVLATGLAHRHRSPLLAILAVGGGYATPFLLDTLSSQIPLFGYAVALACGTFVLARRHDWPLLLVVSYLGSLITLQAWMRRFYRPDDWLVTELFFTALALLFIAILQRSAGDRRPASAAASAILATAPLLYHLASLSLLADRVLALLVYLIAVSAVSLVWTAHLERAWLRVCAWAFVAAPFITLVAERVGWGWVTGTLIAGAAIYGMHLAVHLRSVASTRALPPAELLLLHANGLWAFYAVQALIERWALGWLPAIAAVLGLWNLWVASWIGRVHREAMLHYVALAFTLGAVAIALQFDGPWVVVGWACQGAALALLGLRARETWLRLAGGGLLGLAVAALARLLLAPGVAAAVPFANPRALAAVFVVATLFALARRYGAAEVKGLTTERTVLMVAGHLLALMLLTAEIDTFYRSAAWRAGVIGGIGAAGLARQLTFSIVWAAYAVMLVFLGIRRNHAAVRYLAIAVFATTILKVFLVDLATLDRLYRIGSVLGLGALLISASYLYQRVRAGDAAVEPPPGPPGHPAVEPASHDPA